MAVPISNVTRRQVYAPSGAGGAGPYAFTFEILANTDIAVYKDDVLLTLTTHYTVTINANGTGSVTITAAGLALAPASPTQYAIVGNRTISRTTDFTTGGDFFANTLNDELDQQTIFAQQNAEGLQRALAAPQTDPTSINMTLPRAALRANKALGFDANGNPVISDTLGTNRGNWSAGVLYYARDIVKDTTNNNIWQCLVQHTSSGSQPINTNADSAKWSLLVDAASATTSAANAASSASDASTSASNASTSASNASTSASNASTSASNAASSASAASTSAANAAASYDSFDDRYLGPKSSAPSVDNDGNSLLTGALYWDTALNQMRVWSGTAWVNVNASASNTRTAITATAGQTVLTVATYTPGTNTMVVYVNGVKLNASEYTETNATTVTLAAGLSLNDEVEVFSYRVNEIGTLGASSVTIADTGNYYAGGNVETALQEAAQASTTKFIAAGTGAVATNVQSKLQGELVSVLDFMTTAQRADVLAGTASVDVSGAFALAAAAAMRIRVPKYTYLVNNQVDILDNQTWIFEGAELKHTDDTKHILRANGKTGWSIVGKVVLRGTLVTAATAAETGLYITSGKKYRVEGVEARNFKGKGIWLDGGNPSGLRGDRGQFIDCAAYDSTVGRQIDAGAEYTTWTNFNASGCITGDLQGGGNVVTIGGNIVDNSNGVQLVAGSNHLHGMHVGVNINHNTTFNIETTNVTNGHDFIGCHLYGNGSGSGAIFFNNSKGISIKGGHLDCWVYNYTGASSSYNYITDMYCPGSYGDVKCQDALGNYPAELIVQQCYGPGAYISGVSINDPGPVYVHARRVASSTQSISGHTTLVLPDVQQNGDRRGAYNASTGLFTVPANQAGQYRLEANLYFSGTGLTASSSYVEVDINNAAPRLFLLTPYSTTILTSTLAADFYLNAGDVVRVKASIAGTSPTFGGSSWLSSLSIQRIA